MGMTYEQIATREPTDLDLWSRVEDAARALAECDRPDPGQWLRAARELLGDDEPNWPDLVRDALLEWGCELECRACRGDGARHHCGAAPTCNCTPCDACDGEGMCHG